jgi:hypothetical protein
MRRFFKSTTAIFVATLFLFVLMKEDFTLTHATALTTPYDSFISHTHKTSVPAGYTAIRTKADLETIRKNLTGLYILMNNIDLGCSATKQWVPIGQPYSNKNFSGIFDGNGYEISRIYYDNSDGGCAGFFGYVMGNWNGTAGIIKNLTVSGYVRGDEYIGGIAGQVGHIYTGTVLNCHNKCTVIGIDRVGGITGYVGELQSKISGCLNTGNITATGNSYTNGMHSFVGGIVGDDDGLVSNCLNAGPVTSKGCYTGGVVGNIESTNNKPPSVIFCTNVGTIKSTVDAGGIVGMCHWEVIVKNCKNKGAVSAPIAGGVICAYYRDSHVNTIGGITSCSNTGYISGKYSAGICASSDGKITQCLNTGAVKSTDRNCGGIIGSNSGTVENCYNTGKITGVNNVGGIAGHFDADIGVIKNCYTTGMIAGANASSAAVCGHIFPLYSSKPKNCYYLNTCGKSDKYAKPLTSVQMKKQSSYIGFDFTKIWKMGTGTYLYPVFW